MVSLHEIQVAFATGLANNDLLPIQGMIVDDGLSVARRFGVYRNNFLVSLKTVLSETYPVVERLVGNDCFALLADQYLLAHPSRSGDLNDFGSELEDFLESAASVSTLPYLSAVARLEWACNTVFSAASPTPSGLVLAGDLTPEKLSALCFSFTPACQMIRSQYPIYRIWETNQEAYTGDSEIVLDDRQESVLVVRSELAIEVWRLRPADATFLGALESGENLGTAIEAALLDSKSFALDTALARFVLSGLLVVENLPATPKQRWHDR